ncbi:olfactory receptor 2A25, putative [Babesia ovis]|uniref:Olfactory receptor 2A25, putative n=1 Tax=Babesia ovis TaxID=5869 RepID=A0A9W5TCB1_BABOV|nr:olfactory receptor 2A25, putative [Babesia ovis]
MEGFVSNKKVTKLILGIAAVAGATGGSVLGKKISVADEFNTLSNFGGDYELVDAEKRNEGMFNPVDNFRNGYEETVEKKPDTKLNFHFGNHDELIDPGMRTGEFHTLSNFGGDYELINAEKRNEGMFNPVDNFRNGYEETVDNSIQVGKERYKKILDGIHEYFVENKSLNQYVYLLKTVINRADINLPEPIYRLLGYMKPGDLDTACSVYISHRIARLMVDVFVPQKPITFRGRMARLDLFHMFLALIMEAMNSNTN